MPPSWKSVKPAHTDEAQPARTNEKPSRPDAGTILHGALDALLITEDVLACLEMAPFAQPVIHLALVVLRSIREVRIGREDLGTLDQRIRRMVNALVAATHGVSADVGDSLKRDLVELEDAFKDVAEFVDWMKGQGKLTTFVKRTEFSKRIEDLNTRIDQSLQVFSMQREIEMSVNIRKLVVALDTAPRQPSPAPSRIIPELPPPPFCFSGRATELETLVDSILNKHPARVCILGPGGIGKSALALQAMHDPRVEDAFESTRVFVRLDSAVNAKDILGQTALALGILQKDMTNDVFAVLKDRKRRFLITLDNFEAPWDSAHRTEVERFLAQLAALKNVSLIVTLRGTERPMGIQWTRPYIPPLGPLDLSAAQDLLDSVAGCRDPEWDELLREVDYVPLAVTLLAHLAQSGEEPSTLMARWKEERTELLQRSSHADRESSVAASIQLSLNSSRMSGNPDATRLLSIMSLLPDGVPEVDLTNMFQKVTLKVQPSLSVLRKVALAYKDDQVPLPFIRVLAPIRAFIQDKYPADDELLGLTVRHYFAKAALGREVWNRTTEVLPLLSSQLGNMQAMLSFVLQPQHNFRPYDHLRHPQIISAITGFGKFVEFSNLGDAGVLNAAIHWMVKKKRIWGPLKGPDLSSVAMWHKTCAAILRLRLQHDVALQHYLEALQLFKDANQLPGQGSCLKGMGDIHSIRSDFDKALGLYEEACTAYRQAITAGAKPFAGLGSCLKGIGELCLQYQMLPEALEHYVEAAEMFAAARDFRGEGACLRGIGEIYLRRADFKSALSSYGEGLDLYKASGTLPGQASCAKGLGDVHLERSKLDENVQSDELNAAMACYEDGLALFKESGSLPGQASCLNGIGEVHFQRRELDAAMYHFKEALALFDASAEGEGGSGCASCLQRMGKVYLHKLELDTAHTHTSEALAIYASTRRQLGQAICLQQMGEICMRKSDMVAAEVHFNQALAMFHGHPEQARSIESLDYIHREDIRISRGKH